MCGLVFSTSASQGRVGSFEAFSVSVVSVLYFAGYCGFNSYCHLPSEN